MNDPVEAQYEAYPYPARDPAEEKDRLILGSPSHPFEIDHFLFGGRRDWSGPFRALVAGGGTGDGLIMLAQILADHGAVAQITYLDLSTASRRIAEARAEARGLTNIRFVTGDLLTAAELGPFDYIDCCGVLHHLPDPEAGFRALRTALAEDGGFGGMVYAPYGRAGVYELQDVLRELTSEDPPEERLRLARRVVETLPPTNALRRNPFLGDHLAGDDAGLHDLLLHARDRAYTVDELFATLDSTGFDFVSFAMPGRYEARIMLADRTLRQRVDGLPLRQRAAIAEKLSGNIKTHVFYAAPKGTSAGRIATFTPEAVPQFLNITGSQIAESIWKTGMVRVEQDGIPLTRKFDREIAGIAMAIDGRRTLREVKAVAGQFPQRFDAYFAELYQFLNNFNFLRFSRLGR